NKNENKKYSSKIIGIANICSNISNTRESNRNPYLYLFSAHSKLLIFIENSFISEIRSKEETTVKAIRSQSQDQCGKTSIANGSDKTTKVFIGVFKPIKFSLCRSSKLNLASLSAENMVIKKPK